MKKILVIAILLASCSSHSQKDTSANNLKEIKSAEAQAPVNKYANVTFAATKDLNCGMPLAAGVGDTAHYKGKIYGFCSTECKDDFLKDPAAEIAKK